MSGIQIVSSSIRRTICKLNETEKANQTKLNGIASFCLCPIKRFS